MVLRMRRCTPHGTAFRVGLIGLRAAGTSKKNAEKKLSVEQIGECHPR